MQNQINPKIQKLVLIANIKQAHGVAAKMTFPVSACKAFFILLQCFPKL